jgi:hypothetical protein
MQKMPLIDKRKIISVDPGGTTGLAYLQDRVIFARKEIGPRRKDVKQYMDWCGQALEQEFDSFMPDYIVFEQFDYRTGQAHAELISNEYIGVIKLWCVKNDRPWVTQPARVGKHTGKGVFWNRRKLQAVGLYLPNMGHSMDATSHLLHHWSTTLGQRDYLNLLRNLGDVA